MMEESWKARKMVPGEDTLSIMAMHYGLKPNVVRDVVKQAGVEVIREDGFTGTLTMVTSRVAKRRVIGWSDGQEGVDPDTTKLTEVAIKTISLWKHENDSDS